MSAKRQSPSAPHCFSPRLHPARSRTAEAAATEGAEAGAATVGAEAGWPRTKPFRPLRARVWPRYGVTVMLWLRLWRLVLLSPGLCGFETPAPAVQTRLGCVPFCFAAA